MENYDLEDKIDLLYDYLYNVNNKNCFSLDKITMGKIGLHDIKIQLPENSEDSHEYEKMKKDIMNGRFKLLSYNEDDMIILYKKYSDQFPVNIKICFYNSKYMIDSFDSPINNDSIFSYLLSPLVLSNKTKHILLPIINFDVKIGDIDYLFKNESFYGGIKKMMLNNDIMNTCCMQVREHFFKTANLEEYFTNNKCAIKPLLFQVIHTLAIIQKEHEGFRHNNLLMKNIMIYLKKDNESYSEYTGIEDSSPFYLTGANFDIKITNFENATIPRFYGLGKKNNNVLFSDKINPYYDLYIFLNGLL